MHANGAFGRTSIVHSIRIVATLRGVRAGRIMDEISQSHAGYILDMFQFLALSEYCMPPV